MQLFELSFPESLFCVPPFRNSKVGKAIAMSMNDEFLESRERRHAKESGLQRPVNDLVHGVLGAVSLPCSISFCNVYMCTVLLHVHAPSYRHFDHFSLPNLAYQCKAVHDSGAYRALLISLAHPLFRRHLHPDNAAFLQLHLFVFFLVFFHAPGEWRSDGPLPRRPLRRRWRFLPWRKIGRHWGGGQAPSGRVGCGHRWV